MLPVFMMRIISQNIKKGSIKVADNIIASSDYGLALFVGFTHGDTELIVDQMAQKVMNMRIFPDIEGKTNLSISDVNGSLLVIPNFTLYGSLKKARRPSFTDALNHHIAASLYVRFVAQLHKMNIITACGIFGAAMEITLVNDGPFTMIIDSRDLPGATL